MKNVISMGLLVILLPVFFVVLGGMVLVETAVYFCKGGKLENI